MKISRLLFLGVLASSLCIASSAFGALSLDDSIDPFLQVYQIGDTIEFELCVGVDVGDVNLVDLDVYFFPPGQLPTGGICDNVASDPNAVHIAHIALLEAGDQLCFNSSNNSALAYLVTAADCNRPTSVLAYMATTFKGQGSTVPLCDEKTTENFVLPVDPPTCGIIGPDEVCEGSDGEMYCSEFGADSYLWSVTGGASIVGPDDANCVVVDPNGSGDYTVYLLVCNDNGADGCCNECNLPVTVIDAPDCLINGPDSMCASDSTAEFCSDVNDADSYLWEITSGDATIVGSDTDVCVLVAPGTEQFELKLTICYLDPNCCDSCTKTVDVVPTPDCLIEGPDSVCEDSNNVYCASVEADAYLWEITGDGVIVGPNDVNCVTVSVGAEGSFTLTLTLCNISDTNDCCNTCEKTVAVEPCGQTFCSFTQGFWGNAGGKGCGGLTTTELINLALANAGGTITVGISPRSITFNSAECILASLPAGGTPSALPAVGGPWTCANLSSFYKNKKKTEINNVLVGQAVALTLNLLVSDGCVEDAGYLGDWVLPEEFCVVPYWNPEACPKHYTVPASLVGKSVKQLLDAVNAALGGTGSISDAYDGATLINEGFDECATVVPCPAGEICDNGCDDDFDGLIDLLDPDCGPQ